MRRLAGLAAAAVLLAAAQPSRESATTRVGGDWTRFGYDAARSGSGPRSVGISAQVLKRLVRRDVQLGGTVDASAIYLRGVEVGGVSRDVLFVTTSYGRTIAVDARRGAVLWRFTPEGYASWAGSDRITNSTPVADPGRRFLYAGAPDGRVHKLAVGSGEEVRSGSWPVAITRDPSREKLGTALNVSRGLVLATTGGFIGDQPPYQGHVAAVDARTGRLVHVWNALCSDRHALIDPASCPESGAAIWARSGVVVVPGSGRLLVATGDGRWNGHTYWGDSVLMLSPDARRLLQSWTPADQKRLESDDVDLGTTAPALLSNALAAQGGKDTRLRLLNLARLNGRRVARPATGGELQTLRASGLFFAPAVWRSGGRTWLFVADFNDTTAYVLRSGRLERVWTRHAGGTSPVVAGGLLYVYGGGAGHLRVYEPSTGKLLASLPAGPGHWNSPIVTDGMIALPTGDANQHRTSGTLSLYRSR